MINFELVIDVIIIALLLLTIVYVWRFNRNLSILRENQDSMFGLAQSLNEASDKAEKAVAGLKETANQSSELLQDILEDAQSAKEDLARMIAAASDISSRLENNIDEVPSNAKSAPEIAEAQKDDTAEKSQAELELLKALRSIK